MEFSTGDDVFVVCWHPPLGMGDPGTWEIVPGRVVSIGKMACYEIYNPSLLWGGIHPPVPGSSLRYTKPDRLFATHEAAETFLATNPQLMEI